MQVVFQEDTLLICAGQNTTAGNIDMSVEHTCCAGPQQQEEDAQAESAADTSRPFTSDYLEAGRMADAFEPEEFKGMLFHDGVDSQGRPVIVVNTDAVGTARKARSQALQYMLHRLEPIVTQVCLLVPAWVKEDHASHPQA